VDRLAVASAQSGQREQAEGDVSDGVGSRDAPDVTIREMTSGGALLIALVLQSAQSPIAAPATPEAGPTRARLDLRGPADCVSRADIVARVAARTPRIQLVDDATVYARVELTSTRPGNVVADVVLAAPGTDQLPRRFIGRSCAQAADAIALIIAVTLDPTLQPKASPPERKAPIAVPEVPDAAGGTTVTDPGNGGAAAPAPQPPDQPAPDQKPELAKVAAVVPAVPAAPARREFAATVAGQTIFGPAPAVMPGISLTGMAALDREGAWAPALFVGALHAWRNDLSQTGGAASFTLDAATIDACPLRVGGSALAARPCVTVLLGRLTASGSETMDAASVARFYGAAGAALTASFGSTIQLSGRLGFGMTLLRDTYDFMGPTFHRAGRFTIAASLGVGLRWP
jgi:hypothetical protein